MTGPDPLSWEKGDIVGFRAQERASEPLPAPGLEGADWFVAYAEARSEFSVADAIKALGLFSYVPKRIIITRRPPKRRAVKTAVPLLRHYVFFESFADPRCWASVRAIRNVVGIVSNNLAPMRIRREAIGNLMAAEDMGMFDQSRSPDAVEIIAGDPVSFIGGMYQGYEATVNSVAGRSARVVVVGADGKRDVKVRLDLIRLLA